MRQTRRATEEEALEIFEQDPELLEAVAHWARSMYALGPLPSVHQSLIERLVYLHERCDQAQVSLFGDQDEYEEGA